MPEKTYKAQDEMTSTGNTMLFIHGGDEVMRLVYADEEVGYWTAAFDVILEKHGILDFETATEKALKNSSLLEKYPVIIVGYLPETYWSQEAVNNLKKHGGAVFLEGPFPDFVAQAFGLSKPTGTGSFEGTLDTKDPKLCDYVSEAFRQTLGAQTLHIPIGPKKVLVKNKELARQELRVGEEHELGIRVHDIAISYLLAYRNRFKRFSHFFAPPDSQGGVGGLLKKALPKNYAYALQDALATLGWSLFLSRLEPGAFKDSFLPFLREALASRPVLKSENDNALAASAAYAVAAQIGNKVLGESGASLIIEDVRNRFKEVRLTPHLKAWGLLLDILAGASVEQGVEDLRQLLSSLSKRIPAQIVFISYLVREVVAESRADLYAVLDDFFRTHFPSETLSDLSNPQYEGRHLWECLVITSILPKESPVSRKLIAEALDTAFDKEKGLFYSGTMSDGEYTVTTSFQIAPWIPLGLLTQHESYTLWDPTKALEAYDSQVVERWEASPLKFVQVETREAVNLASLTTEAGESCGFFRDGNVTGATFSILSHLVHFHTMHPLKEAFSDCDANSLLVLEHLFFRLLRQVRMSGPAPAITVGDWPWGKTYCLSIRHDVDRPMTPEIFDRLFQFECENELGVSWYWLPGRLDLEQMRALQKANHEIGLHSLRLNDKPNELAAVTCGLDCQEKIYGEQYHGGGGGDYWIGHPTIVSAIDAGLLYTEFVATINDLPYAAFPSLLPDGRIGKEEIVGTTRFLSVDNAARLTKDIREARINWLSELANNGFHCTVLNHPDANLEELAHWVAQLPRDGRLNWSYLEVSKWWQATHTRNALKVVQKNGKIVIKSSDTIDGLSLLIEAGDSGIGEILVEPESAPNSFEWEKIEFGKKIRLDIQAGETVTITFEKG